MSPYILFLCIGQVNLLHVKSAHYEHLGIGHKKTAENRDLIRERKEKYVKFKEPLKLPELAEKS
jgi:hypothetical protein